MKTKALTLLGFAAKAGKLSFGFSATEESLERKKVRLVVTANDISPKSKKEVIFKAQKSGYEVLSLNTTSIFELSNAVGHKCGIISVNDEGFAEAIKEEILNDQ
ncbi:MAG: ribosomal L7Ae/L30e/S12e/Gadd45 family protein [Clostridia bacterium]|nr:ribosomal L7Ae/L30e/S12e/Gadd45 family protein [Clostridia bacterium]